MKIAQLIFNGIIKNNGVKLRKRKCTWNEKEAPNF